MKLTPNQLETLHLIVLGRVSGMMLKPIPSLLKKALVSQRTETVAIRSFLKSPSTMEVTRYILTPEGLAFYVKFRRARRDSELRRVNSECEQDLGYARSLTETPSK